VRRDPRYSVRPARPGDLDAVREISDAYGNLAPWPERPDFLDHEWAAGRMYVAESGSEIMAFGGSFDRGDVVYVADLFVRPGVVGRGLGSGLLRAIFDREGVRLTMGSGDPRAIPLYARFGMRPVMPALYVEGDAAAVRRLEAAPESLGPATAEELVDIDAEVSGRLRPQELRFLGACPGAEGFRIEGPAGPAAYGWVRTATVPGAVGGGRHAFVGPMGGRTEDDMDGVTRALARRAIAGVSRVHFLLLGPHPSLAALLEAGFRLVDHDTWMCSRLDLVDGRRYAPSPEFG